MTLITKSSPLVSIVTSCYNHEKYLDDYMTGLLSQSYPNLELILFDDGSQDGSWAKIESYEERLTKKFKRVVCERHENRGFIREFDWALRFVQGEFVCFTSSDDAYLPDMVQECVAYLESHPDIGAVHTDTDYVYEDHVEPRHWKSIGRSIPEGHIFQDLLEGNFIMTDSACFRTGLVRRYVNFKEYASRNYLMEDYPMCLDLSPHTKFGYIDKALTRYRVLPESASHSANARKKFHFWKSYYQIKFDYIEKYGAPDEIKNRAVEKYHRGLYYQGYETCLKKECREGYRWLVRRYPEEYKTPRHFLRMSSTHSRLLWKLLQGFQGAL